MIKPAYSKSPTIKKKKSITSRSPGSPSTQATTSIQDVVVRHESKKVEEQK